MEKTDEKYYQVADADSPATRLMIRARDRIYADFIGKCRPSATDKILDVGVSDVVNDAANLLERAYAHPENITAAGLGSGEEFRAAFPKVTYQRINAGERLPFEDGAFDFAVSNAVLEHVGSFEAQKSFVAELSRVSKCVFITVPNRFFPVEHHTAIPFLHWNDTIFRLACRAFGKSEWANPANLILMSRARLLASVGPQHEVDCGYTGIQLGGMSSNMFLVLRARDYAAR